MNDLKEITLEELKKDMCNKLNDYFKDYNVTFYPDNWDAELGVAFLNSNEIETGDNYHLLECHIDTSIKNNTYRYEFYYFATDDLEVEKYFI